MRKIMRNKNKVYLAVGFVVGYWLGLHYTFELNINRLEHVES